MVNDRLLLRYNYPLNTKHGFRILYYLMKLTGRSMNTVLIDIIKVREEDIGNIIDTISKLADEDKAMLVSLTGRQ